MKILIALSTIFLLFTLTRSNDTPSVDEMLEIGRKGVIQTIVNNYRPRPAAPDISLKKVYKMVHDKRIGGELYTFTVDFKNNAINKVYRLGGDDVSVCKITFSLFHFESGGVYFDRMKTEDLACRVFSDLDKYLPRSFLYWVDA